MNIHVPQSIQTINEIKRIANVKYQIVGVKNSIPIIGCEQDTLSGAYMLTFLDVKLKGTDVANILCNTTTEFKKDIDLNKIYSGQEIFSFIIPKGINIIRKKDNNTVEIIDGILKSGYLDSSLLSSTKNSIIHFIWDKFGPDKTKKFIDDSQKLILHYLLYCGQTSGFQDTYIDENMNKQIQQIIQNDILKNKYNITQFENDSLLLSIDFIENKLSEELTVIQSKIGQILMNYLNNKNFFHISVKSGAKGSLTHISQMLGVIGQVNLEGVRFKKKIE
jgi:DNA-directed RNA polymerase beta' subunit